MRNQVLEWDPNRDKIAETLEASIEHLKTDRTEQDILFELLLKLGLDLCVPIETRKIAGHEVHSIGAGTLLACLSKSIPQADVEPLAAGLVAWHKEESPSGEPTVVFRDSAFADDVAKTNLAAILKLVESANKFTADEEKSVAELISRETGVLLLAIAAVVVSVVLLSRGVSSSIIGTYSRGTRSPMHTLIISAKRSSEGRGAMSSEPACQAVIASNAASRTTCCTSGGRPPDSSAN